MELMIFMRKTLSRNGSGLVFRTHCCVGQKFMVLISAYTNFLSSSLNYFIIGRQFEPPMLTVLNFAEIHGFSTYGTEDVETCRV
jgi:hypothetical protein